MKCVKKIMLGVLMVVAIGVVITACGKDKNTTDNSNKPNTESTTNDEDGDRKDDNKNDTKDLPDESGDTVDGTDGNTTDGSVTDGVGEGLGDMGENVENLGDTTTQAPAGTDGAAETTPAP